MKIEEEIIKKIDDKEIEKTFNKLNHKLSNLGIEDIEISVFSGHAPFDSAFLNQKASELEIPVSQLGSGIEMIISILFLETLASLSKENFIVIIDEPELHLHPILQAKFINYLITLSEKNQVILSTHSPYFFRNCVSNPNIELLVCHKNTNHGKINIENTSTNFGLFRWSPSWGEINFHAYNLPTIEFHNELYGFIQNMNSVLSESSVENFFEVKKIPKTKQWIKVEQNGQVNSPKDLTLMTYIRNAIHHSENTHNLPYSEVELKSSIETMISILKNP